MACHDTEANDGGFTSAKVERLPLMQHAETAEFSLEAGDLLRGSGLTDRRLEPVVKDRAFWQLCCVAYHYSCLRFSDVDNSKVFRNVLTVTRQVSTSHCRSGLASAGRKSSGMRGVSKVRVLGHREAKLTLPHSTRLHETLVF